MASVDNIAGLYVWPCVSGSTGEMRLNLKDDKTCSFAKQADSDLDLPLCPVGHEYEGSGHYEVVAPDEVKVTGSGRSIDYGITSSDSSEAKWNKNAAFEWTYKIRDLQARRVGDAQNHEVTALGEYSCFKKES